MFCRSFGTHNTVGAFILRFNPKKGQYMVKLGEIRPNFYNQFFPLKMPNLSSFVSVFQKMLFILHTAIRNARNALRKK